MPPRLSERLGFTPVSCPSWSQSRQAALTNSTPHPSSRPTIAARLAPIHLCPALNIAPHVSSFSGLVRKRDVFHFLRDREEMKGPPPESDGRCPLNFRESHHSQVGLGTSHRDPKVAVLCIFHRFSRKIEVTLRVQPGKTFVPSRPAVPNNRDSATPRLQLFGRRLGSSRLG